jgi:hypothetical protein
VPSLSINTQRVNVWNVRNEVIVAFAVAGVSENSTSVRGLPSIACRTPALWSARS